MSWNRGGGYGGGYGGRGGGYAQQMQFTNWNYGYTLQQTQENQWHMEQNAQMMQRGGMRGSPGGRGRGFGGGRGGPTGRGRGGGPPGGSSTSESTTVATNQTKTEVKVEEKEKLEEGEISSETPLSEILGGKNPIVFCNEVSKFKCLKLDWEQISETGPPHDKTFTWSLQMGDTTTIGVSNTKKGAKTKAAEEMARKLDTKFPGLRTMMKSKGGTKRPYQDDYGTSYMPTTDPHESGNSEFQQVQNQLKKARFKEQNKKAMQNMRDQRKYGDAGKPKAEPHPETAKTVQNNPISRLYEYAKKQKWPEPLFEVISENVLDQYRTTHGRKTASGEYKGFMLKKTEFTIQCELQGKKFIGNALTKKDAKYNAAAAAWAEFGPAKVTQSSVQSMLQEQRDKQPPGTSSKMRSDAIKS